MNRVDVSRRRFLSASAASLAGASLTTAAARSLFAQSAAAVPARTLGWAFVGLGGFAQHQLLPGIARCQYSKCVAVVTGHPEKVTQPNAKLDGKSIKDYFGLKDADVYRYENFDAIKDNPAIDVVYVVLPNGMHCEYSVRASRAGKHVMCEKPMANTVAEGQQMIDAANAAGKRLQIGYRMHWDAPTAACIASIRKGEIGKVQIIEAAQGFNIGAGAWRLNRKLAGGGCLMDIGIYALNAARYLSGEEPTEVIAHTAADRDDPQHRFDEVEGSCDWQLKFPSGVLASCISSYACNGLGRYVVHGSKGTAVLDPSSRYMEPPYDSPTQFHLGRGGSEPKLVDVAPADQFVGEIDGFSLALQKVQPFKATGEEGLRDLRIIEAIYESARTNKAIAL